MADRHHIGNYITSKMPHSEQSSHAPAWERHLPLLFGGVNSQVSSTEQQV